MSTTQSAAPIFVVSGGSGASGNHLLQTVLAQFEGCTVPITLIPSIRELAQVGPLVEKARQVGALIAHTLVDATLRSALIRLAKQYDVAQIDLVGPLMDQLTARLEQQPLGHPGRYYHLNRGYFDRIAAIEYTLAHDDGQHPEGWCDADVVLTGVSRTGKTPLSVYLSMLGWKVANVPVVPEWTMPPQLRDIDPHRVVGLTIDLERLLTIRQARYLKMGIHAPSDYINPQSVAQELKDATGVFRRLGFRILNVTNRPIESSADEVIHHLQTSEFARN